MINDPQAATGRTMPAQLKPAPMVQPELPEDVFAEAQRAATMPEPPAAAAPLPAVRGELVPPPSDTPSTSPLVPLEGGAPAVPQSTPTPSPAYAPTIGSPAARPGPVTAPVSMALSPGPEAATDEERALMHVLRMLDRVVSPGTLSPVERAFVAGAKIMFDQLSKECRTMLKRTPADLTRDMTPPGQTPRSVGNVLLPDAPRRTEGSGVGKRKTKAKPDQTPKR